ncbi:hypothetical protein CSB20_06850 [bacterium DOLZORAL124_64_63]|nr:MAG: hypothetical protein CSB20_06850 [bacterium DOLZORAL124_64_63]
MQLPDMKQILFSILAVAGLLSFFSCERHEWQDSAEGKKDGTKNLYPKEEKGHGHAHDHDHDHGGHAHDGEAGHH